MDLFLLLIFVFDAPNETSHCAIRFVYIIKENYLFKKNCVSIIVEWFSFSFVFWLNANVFI